MKSNTNYVLRLVAKNEFGWSEGRVQYVKTLAKKKKVDTDYKASKDSRLRFNWDTLGLDQKLSCRRDDRSSSRRQESFFELRRPAQAQDPAKG